MAADPADIRFKLDHEYAIVIRAIAHARDIDQTEVVRQIVSEYCRLRIHETRVLANIAAGEGVPVANRRRSGRGI